MITTAMQEVFNVLRGYLKDNSAYSPLVTKQAPLRPTKFPVVEVKGAEMPLDTTLNDEEVINKLTLNINVYAIEQIINGQKKSSLQIADELIMLIDKAMNEMRFRLITNDEIANIDKNVYRRFLRYTAGVNTATNKILRRN